MRILFFILPVFILASSCKQAESGSDSKASTSAPLTDTQTYPGLPFEVAKNLLENCTYIDYLYYSLPISMSFNEPNGVRSAISHISDTPAPIKPDCKAIGRISYQNNGETLLEADMYFSPGCIYFTFLENGKAKYGNLMTTDAIKFYEGMIKQVTATPNGN